MTPGAWWLAVGVVCLALAWLARRSERAEGRRHVADLLSVLSAKPRAMTPIVIDIPDLAVSAETELPIAGPARVRLYIGPDIELVMSELTAERMADALVDADALPDRPVVTPPSSPIPNPWVVR